MYTVSLKPKAAKYIEKQSDKIKRQLIGQIEKLEKNPRPQNCVELHREKQIYRVKSGNYRIIYQIQDRKLIVLVATVGDRKDIERIYRNLTDYAKNFPSPR